MIQEIIPNKEEMSVMKIYTHSGEGVIIYCLLKTPIFFEIEKNKTTFPTVYTLWKFPGLLPVFTTWPDVLNKISSGADLMLPGVVVSGAVTPKTFVGIRKNEICSIKLVGNKAPVAIGQTAMSGEEMYECAMRGKGILIIHSYKDNLWAVGDKSEIPQIEDDGNLDTNPTLSDCNHDSSQGCATCIPNTYNGQVADKTNIKENPVENDNNSDEFSIQCDKNVNGICDININNDLAQSSLLEGAVGGSVVHDISEDEVEEEDELSIEEITERMDRLLYHCFLCAIKSSVKKTDLPLLTSAFYKLHMQPFCPSGQTIDIKKSSYKKLGKFLQTMQRKDLVKVKELTKGVDSITEVNKDHLELRGFVVPDITENVTRPKEAGVFQPPEIVQLYTITTPVLPVFKDVNQSYSKGMALTVGDVRKTVTEYVKINELQEKSQVTLDPILSHLVLQKSEYAETMRWDELLNRIVNKMSSAYQFTVEGQKPVIKKGKLEPVTLKVESRMGGKKVTLVHNLELFGIDVQEFAHSVQKGVACSTTINQIPGKHAGKEVMVQGNQVRFIAQLITDKYQLPQKFIHGQDQAPKSGKKKR